MSLNIRIQIRIGIKNLNDFLLDKNYVREVKNYFSIHTAFVAVEEIILLL